MNNSKETMTKKQQDDLASTFNNVPWALPLGFPSMPPFGAFPPFGLSTPNFPPLPSFPSPTTTSFTSSPLSTNPTSMDVWSNNLSSTNTNIDFNEYVKQLGVLMNAFNEKPKQSETDKSKISVSTEPGKSKSSNHIHKTSSSSSENVKSKTSASKHTDESHSRPMSTSSKNPSKSSTSSSSIPKSSTKSSINSDLNSLDPLAFAAATAAAAAATGSLPFPYFLPSLFSQPPTTNTLSNNTNTNTSSTNTTTNYPFSSLSSSSSSSPSLLNSTAALYPFLSPDWLASSSKIMENFSTLPSDKSNNLKRSPAPQISQSKHITCEKKHLSSVNSLLNQSFSPSKSKKRSKSIRALTEEQDANQEKLVSNNSLQKLASTNASLLQSALMKSANDVVVPSSITSFSSSIDSTFKPILFDNTFYNHQQGDSWKFKPIKEGNIEDNDTTSSNGLFNLSRRSSVNDTSSNRQTPITQSADESKSNDDDDSDPNPKRRKTEEVNEALARIPINLGWKRVTIVRAITRTGVRGDVSYFAPCGRKLRSFQEIDRYLSKKNPHNLDRSHFTFSSKVNIGFFHEPKEGPDGKAIFHESSEEEIINRILEINPKFRRMKYENENEVSTKTSNVASPSMSTNHSNIAKDYYQQDLMQQMYDETRKHRQEQEEISKRTADSKIKNDQMRLFLNAANETLTSTDRLTNSQYQHNDLIKVIMEQQKLVQQKEFEHKKKLQLEQQEQERKRQELAYLKQLEIKKRQEEKLQLIEQRKAEKNAEREKKIQERYMEIVLARESKRIIEDMQIKDVKPLAPLKTIENMRLSAEGFANALMIIQFLNNFKQTLEIPDNLIPTLNSVQQMSSTRDMNTLCQLLLNIALDDPGIPNPKKSLTNLGQKLSEIDITEHTFSEILRLYIRERNGFDDKITQNLSDISFQSLGIDEKLEILAFLCNDLSFNKRIVEEVDRALDELVVLKHEKLEIEKRLRRLKYERLNNINSNNVKKPSTLTREKDLNSSENESPDESESESMKNDDESSITNDPAAATADDQDIETIDETKIDDLDKRLTLVTKKYALIKRRVIDKQCRTRALHLGQDRYRRRYWYFSHLPGIYVEALTTGDIPPDDIKDIVENATKQKFDKTEEINSLTRSTQRKKQQAKNVHSTALPVTSNHTNEPVNKVKNENCDADDEEDDDEKQQPAEKTTSNNTSEDLSTMDLSAFCISVQQDDNTTKIKDSDENDNQPIVIKIEPNEENSSSKRHFDETNNDDNLPLDLSCSKVKKICEQDFRTMQQNPATDSTKTNPCEELNGHSTTVVPLNNIKQETIIARNILDLTINNAFITDSVKQEPLTNNFKIIEESIREKFQYAEPLPIPDDVQIGWWSIQTPDELRSLIKSLTKRGQRERYLCRMLQRYFDLISHSMKLNIETNMKNELSSTTINQIDDNRDEQQQLSSNDSINGGISNSGDQHEMDILHEIYNLSDRVIASSLHCRSYDTSSYRKRLTYSDIQNKGSDILDEAKHLITDIERNIERRYLKPPFVRRYEINVSSLNRINQNSTYHHTDENSTNEIVSSSKYDEVPQQLERWRRTVNESRTPAQLALCLTQLERCIAWEKSVMKVYCEICNCDNDEEKLLLCDGCDHGTHTYCFLPPMSFIPPNDWYCYVCIGRAKGENLCFVCGNKGDSTLNRCEHCTKLFHEDCLKHAKQQRGKWLCVMCAANDTSSVVNNGSTTTKSQIGRQTSRSTNSRQQSNSTNSSGDINNQTSTTTITSSTGTNRSKTNNNRKSKPNQNENLTLHESHSNSSHADATIISSQNGSPSIETNDTDDDNPSPKVKNTTSKTNNNNNNSNNHNNSKKKSSKKSKVNDDAKACRIILNELLRSDVSWPFQTPVDEKEHPEYYECVKNPMDFTIIKRKMRNNQYKNRDDFFHDMELILNNCEYYNEDDSPVGQAGHLLRTLFQSQWAKQFG